MFGSILGGALSLIGANKAAKAQTKAANNQIAEQRRQFDLTRADLAAGRESYNLAHGKLQDVLGGNQSTEEILKQNPAYQFQLQQGEQALNRQAAASGRRLGPSVMKDLLRFNSGLNAGAHNTYMNYLLQTAGLGGSSVNQGATLGQANANAISGAYAQQGAAQAQGFSNMNDAIQGTLKNIYTLQNYNKTLGGSINPAGYNILDRYKNPMGVPNSTPGWVGGIA